ncbi:MAG: SwmB domain-containing protein, partial [Dehalococcoidia bacterium]|nr:SwmB domain-containing protein [Dehalococcoidia bacterium]
ARATPTSPPENNAEAATAAVAAAPPAVSNIKVDGATVTVTFAVDLAAVSSVDTLHLYWTISGTAVDQHPNRASVSGRTVTLEIGTPAVAGQTITVSYESSGHLKDADGNAVESFSVTATNLTQ